MKTKVLVVATSRKTRGGITAVVKAHEKGEQWEKYHCKWIETHRDGNSMRKLWYLIKSLIQYAVILPFYDLVHIHVGLRKSVERKLIFAKLAKLFGKRIIIHFHPATEKHLFENGLKDSLYKLFTYSDVLIVLSNQWISWINKAFPGNNFTFRVLYNPCPNATRNFCKKQSIILYAGILSDRKGYGRLISAFRVIAHHYPGWKLIFAGNGEIENGRKLAEEMGIATQIEFLGWVSGKEKEEAFQRASIYCLPSWGEGFPMGVLDAISYGVPIVTTSVGGIPDLIIDGRNGLIFDPYDTDMLAKKLSILIESSEMRERLVYEADKLMNNELNVVNVNNGLSKIYEEIFGGKIKNKFQKNIN